MHIQYITPHTCKSNKMTGNKILKPCISVYHYRIKQLLVLLQLYMIGTFNTINGVKKKVTGDERGKQGKLFIDFIVALDKSENQTSAEKDSDYVPLARSILEE